MVWIILGSLCFAYYAIIEYFSDGQQMTIIWIVLAVLFLCCYLWKEFRKRHPGKKKPLWFRTFCCTSLCLLLVLLGVTASRIILNMFASPEPALDYIVVLSQGDVGGESEAELVQRLNRTAAYLRENPETSVIISGGWNAENDAENPPKAKVLGQELTE